MDKLFLIDAYALIFRFHYAFVNRPFRNVKGENISAVFGFFKFLNELIDREHPHHLGVAFDPKGGNFRHELYPKYKANRSATPEDIVLAVPYIKEILEARAIPILEVAGYEADDVIGTLAIKASQTGLYDTYMVTPDKDYGQLIRSNVSMYKPAKGGEGVDIIGLDKVRDNYCIESPEQIIDILALWGDVADNIPGVPGIGQKGACKLVGQWGTVENIIANADTLSPKQRDSILDNREQLMLSKTLATIALDVPIEFCPEKLVMQRGDDVALRILYKAQGFNMFLREMDSGNYHNNLASYGDMQNSPEGCKVVTPYSQLVNPQLSLFDQPVPSGGLDAECGVPNVGGGSPSSAPVVEHQELRDSLPVDGEQEFSTIRNTPHTYHVVSEVAELKALVDSILRDYTEVCFDTETTSLDPLRCSLVGLSLAVQEHEAYWIPTDKSNLQGVLEAVRPLLENEKVAKIGQNLKYDILVLRHHGLEVRGRLLDTMIIHYLIDSQGRHSMDGLAREFLDYNPVPIEDLIGKGASQLSMDRVAAHLVAEYAAEDADITLQLYHKLWPKLEAINGVELYNKIEEPLIATLANIESEGVKIDTVKLAESATVLNAGLVEMEQEIRTLAGIGGELNVNSPKQLGEVLFETLAIGSGKAKRTKTGQYRTDEQTLEALSGEHPIIPLILKYRGVKKLVSTYIEALPLLINPETGRIHTSFNQAVTTTGRLSSTNPNLQNIPIREELGRQIRAAFVAREGYELVAADYSQVELRIMAHLSGDKNLQQAFLEGQDVHTATASKIYGVPSQDVTREQRRRAKMANFGIIYGISTFGLAQRLSIPRAEAKELIDGYFDLYPAVKTYMERIMEQATRDGYIETIFHRRRYLPEITSRNAVMRGLAQRNAINAPIQGSAADIIKLAMTRLDEELRGQGFKARIILQVHDELVIESPVEELDRVKELTERCMSQAAVLSVPLLVDVGVGGNWLEAH